MQKIPTSLRSKVRGDALKILNTRAFITPYDAFIMGVEYGLTAPIFIGAAAEVKKESSVIDGSLTLLEKAKVD